MTTVTQLAPASEMTDWPGSPLSTVHSLTWQALPIPIEQYPEGGSYVFRLEIPGVDPGPDLVVSVQTGTLSVEAERRDDGPEGRQSEFRYGHYARHISLPLGANTADVSAVYHNGILTVRIGMEPAHQREARTVAVQIEP